MLLRLVFLSLAALLSTESVSAQEAADTFTQRVAATERAITRRADLYDSYLEVTGRTELDRLVRTTSEFLGGAQNLTRMYLSYIRIARLALEQARAAHVAGDTEEAEARLAYAARIESVALPRLWGYLEAHRESGARTGAALTPVLAGVVACGGVEVAGPAVMGSVAAHLPLVLPLAEEPTPSERGLAPHEGTAEGSESSPPTPTASASPSGGGTRGAPSESPRPRWRLNRHERELRRREERLAEEFRGLLTRTVHDAIPAPLPVSAEAGGRDGLPSATLTSTPDPEATLIATEALAVAQDSGVLERTEEILPSEVTENSPDPTTGEDTLMSAADAAIVNRFGAALEEMPEVLRTREELIRFAREGLRASVSETSSATRGDLPADFAWMAFWLDRDRIRTGEALSAARRESLLNTWTRRRDEISRSERSGRALSDAMAEQMVRYYLGVDNPRSSSVLRAFSLGEASSRQRMEMMLASLQSLQPRLAAGERLGVQLVEGEWRTVIVRANPISLYDPVTGTEDSTARAPVYAPAALLHAYLTEEGALAEADSATTLESLVIVPMTEATPAVPAPSLAATARTESPVSTGIPVVDGMPILFGGGNPLAGVESRERDPELGSPTRVTLGERTSPPSSATASLISEPPALDERQLGLLREGLRALGMLPDLLRSIPAGVDIMELITQAMAMARAAGLGLDDLGDIERLRGGLFRLATLQPALIQQLIPVLRRMADSGDLLPVQRALRQLTRWMEEEPEDSRAVLTALGTGGREAVNAGTRILAEIQTRGTSLTPAQITSLLEVARIGRESGLDPSDLRTAFGHLSFGAGASERPRRMARRSSDDFPGCLPLDDCLTRMVDYGQVEPRFYVNYSVPARTEAYAAHLHDRIPNNPLTQTEIEDILAEEFTIPAATHCNMEEIGDLWVRAIRRVEAEILAREPDFMDRYLSTDPSRPSRDRRLLVTAAEALCEDPTRYAGYIWQVERRTEAATHGETPEPADVTGGLEGIRDAIRMRCREESLFEPARRAHVGRWARAITEDPEGFLAYFQELPFEQAARLSFALMSDLRLDSSPLAASALAALQNILTDPARVEIAPRLPLYVRADPGDEGSIAADAVTVVWRRRGREASETPAEARSVTDSPPLPRFDDSNGTWLWVNFEVTTPVAEGGTGTSAIAPRAEVTPREAATERPRRESRRERRRRGDPRAAAETSAIRLSPSRLGLLLGGLYHGYRAVEDTADPAVPAAYRERWLPGTALGITASRGPRDVLQFLRANRTWLAERESGSIRFQCPENGPVFSISPELARALAVGLDEGQREDGVEHAFIPLCRDYTYSLENEAAVQSLIDQLTRQLPH